MALNLQDLCSILTTTQGFLMKDFSAHSRQVRREKGPDELSECGNDGEFVPPIQAGLVKRDQV
jgi:hypothetical protein